MERLLASGFLGIAVVEILGSGHVWSAPVPVSLILAAAMAVSLPCVRSQPLLAFGLVALPSSAYALIWHLPSSVVAFFASGWAALGVGMYRGSHQREAVVALLVFTGVVELTQPSITGPEDAIFPVAYILAAYISGRLVRQRQQLVDRLHGQQELVARAAVVDERTRIARELHDVVAHSVSVMVVQAAGGRAQLRRNPERAEEMLASIERTGKEALSELRRLLGVLRIGPEEVTQLAPQPGLAEVPGLVQRAAEAGVKVSVHIRGARRELPAGADLVAYRIVQEAITNVLRHSGSPTAQLTLGFGETEFTVEVLDDGRGDGRSAYRDGAGHGLAGIRERAALYDGRVETGSRPQGGYSVRAWLPLAPPDRASARERA